MDRRAAIDFRGTRLRPWVRTSACGPTLCYTTPLQCRNNICKRKTFRRCCHCCSVTAFSTAFQKLPFWEIWKETASLSEAIPIWLSSTGGLFWSKKKWLNVYQPTEFFVRINNSPVRQHGSEELHMEKERGSLPTIVVSRAGCHFSEWTMAPEPVWNLQS